MNKVYSLGVGLALALCGAANVTSPCAASPMGGTGSSTMAVRDLIAQFQKTSGATVYVANSLDERQSVPVPAGLFLSRDRLMENVAGAIGANWRKTWIVTAATTARPEIAASDIRRVIDTSGTVSFDVHNLSAVDAIRTVAKADGADVRIIGTVTSAPVSLDTNDLSIGQAIALVSKQTHTNWALTYRLWPKAPEVAAVTPASRLLHRRAIDIERDREAALNAPLKIHFQYPPTGPDPQVLAAIAADQQNDWWAGPPIVTSAQPNMTELGNGFVSPYAYNQSGLYTGLVDGLIAAPPVSVVTPSAAPIVQPTIITPGPVMTSP